MSQTAAYQQQPTFPKESPIHSVRSKKLRSFFIKNPSFLRFLVPDLTFASKRLEFQKNPIAPLEILAQENPEFFENYKIQPLTQRADAKKAGTEDTAVFPGHKITRSRSSNELERMIGKYQSPDLLTKVTAGAGVPKEIGLASSQQYFQFANKKTFSPKTKGRNSRGDFLERKEFDDKEVIQILKGNLGGSSKRDSIAHIVELIGSVGPNDANRQPFELDMLSRKESDHLSSIVSGDMSSVQHAVPDNNNNPKEVPRSSTGKTQQNDNFFYEPPTANTDKLASTHGASKAHESLYSKFTGKYENIANQALLQSQKKSTANTTQQLQTTGKIPSYTQQNKGSAVSGQCRVHPNSAISHICTKENCGKLLCQYCTCSEHAGGYEDLASFPAKIRQELTQTHRRLITTVEQAQDLQGNLGDSNKFGLKFVEDLSSVETAIVRQVHQFFDNLREEFSSQFLFDLPKLLDNLTILRQALDSTIQGVDEDLRSVVKEVNPQLLSNIVQKDHTVSSMNYKKALSSIEERVKNFIAMNENNRDSMQNLKLETNPGLVSQLNYLLTDGVRILEKSNTPPQRLSQSKSARTLPLASQLIPEAKSEAYRSVPKETPSNNKTPERVKVGYFSRRLTNFDEKKQAMIEREMQQQQEKEERVKEQEQTTKKRTRTVSPWKNAGEASSKNTLTNGFTTGTAVNTMTNIQQTMKTTKSIYGTMNILSTSTPQKNNGDRDIDIPEMRFLIDYMEKYYGGSKIKVMDPTFFPALFNISDTMELSDFGRKELFFENVTEELQSGFGKGRCVFTSYERVFLLGRVKGAQWILVEVRSNPKLIILYDFLGKLQKTKFSENLFALMIEVIRREYNMKLGQNPENYLWEKRVATQPTLIVKDMADTGVIALKVISNCYQNKEFSSAKVTINEINMTRKKMEKIFKMYEEKKNHEKFVPI